LTETFWKMQCPSTERAAARRDTRESFMAVVVEVGYNWKTGELACFEPSHNGQSAGTYTAQYQAQANG
jgi:hypothetical protein